MAKRSSKVKVKERARRLLKQKIYIKICHQRLNCAYRNGAVSDSMWLSLYDKSIHSVFRIKSYKSAIENSKRDNELIKSWNI